MARPQHLLVFRFSSLGDVAMTVPVIRLLLAQHPGLQVTVVSTAFVQPLFEGIERLHFYKADLKGSHKGVRGLLRLSRELRRKVAFDAVADLHNVLRTQLLRVFLRYTLLPMAAIDKGRKEKKELTRPQNKILRPLKSTFQRYADVFASLGFNVQLRKEEGLSTVVPSPQALKARAGGIKLVGIAPFAQFNEKVYPLHRMKEVIRLLVKDGSVRVWLFGGREDVAQLEQWESEMDGVSSMAGKFSLREELSLIAGLDVMVSMDSANMHLASLVGVPVVSVWGGTHPWLGFYGWGQPEDLAVQVELDCRPSSVFGNKPCPRGDMACMNNIVPLMIVDKIQKALAPSL